MATVTKIKGEVFNRNLPILLPDGNLTNYYFGNFINKIEEMGYSPTPEEKDALDKFIKSGMNSWIDYMYYFVPFIGDQTNPNAGTVPLIDNIDNYSMAEYDDTSYGDMFQYDANGKIVSLHNSQNKWLKTPLNYSKDKGYTYIMSARFIEATSNNNNFITTTQTVLSGGVNKYVRFVSRDWSYSPLYQNSLWTFTDANTNHAWSNLNAGVQYSIENVRTGVFWQGLYHDGNDILYAKQGYNVGSATFEKQAKVTSYSIESLDYGKIDFGRNISNSYIKCFGLINPYIHSELIQQLSDNISELITELGR